MFLWHFKPISLRKIFSQKMCVCKKKYFLEGLTDSRAEPRSEAGVGQLDIIGGEEDSHAGHDDTEVDVLDGLDGLHLLDQLLLVHAYTNTPKP